MHRSPAARAACALIALTWLIPARPAVAQTQPSLDAALDAIAAFAPRAMREQGTPGLSIAITDRSKTLRIVTLGYANRDLRTPVTPQTRFAIGSITKSMTALAVLQLHDAGSVDLNAPAKRYLPWFAIDSGGKQVLVHELLSHTAGIPDDYALEMGYQFDVYALRRAKTLFPPGSAWSYSNDGYATLGAIVASLDRRPWATSLQARVFDPIGMTASSSVFTPAEQDSAAVGYQFRDNDRPAPLDPALVASPPMDFVDPAGSVLSTPEDMARYMRFYLNGGKTENGAQLIAPATFDAMTRPDALTDGKPAGSAGVVLKEAPAFYKAYGYGLSIFDEGGDRVIGHTGGVSGYTACMEMNLTRGYGVIAFANLVEAPLHPCAIVLYAMRVLRAQSLGQALPEPPPAPDPARVERAADYAGTYTSSSGATLRVETRGNGLALVDGPKTVALYPRGDDEFWADDPSYAQYLLAFGRDKSGRIVEMNYGAQWFPNERYGGPRTFTHPASWDALVGRYENVYLGDPIVTRVIVVKDRLTLDGTDALRPLPDGGFAIGTSTVRFDAYAGTVPQRLTIDDGHFYRVELP
ncbi:MAG TPA: serine hydrolase domain-containing protein [Candidatus Binatia bacterium]|nr:serine hydrolase domain-containing protein [Candidatus Binatia bacterium]